MKIKNLAKVVFATLLLASVQSTNAQATDKQASSYSSNLTKGDCGSQVSFDSQSHSNQSDLADNYSYGCDNNLYSYKKHSRGSETSYSCRSKQSADRANRSNRYYNTSFNAGNYPSGISSYSGTSTGAGISNGYHSTPNGTYKTDRRYHDRNTKANLDAYYQMKR
ncbi:hypothetical protein [Candidatus Protochlamydia amoebophila]|uniref:Secreted protein n=1 Tax=Candidatus Protochlamydia amoebophila TaxID=362787 RepID=A0A0C1H7I6_9BACT|nr:hypothetical protein [Candidatus Protochlamydia amoebophila]KIC70873.1 hypothetical protein DB44_FL00330 [Candidatus Protochlamydia amoebophila]